MHLARPGDFACYVGPDSTYATGPWCTASFSVDSCGRVADLKRYGLDVDSFSNQLQRLSAPMRMAYGWRPACACAYLATLVMCLAVTSVFAFTDTVFGFVSIVLLVSGPIVTTYLAFYRSLSSVSKAVDDMETVVCEINREIFANGLRWEHWKDVNSKTPYASSGVREVWGNFVHCWSLTALTPETGHGIVGVPSNIGKVTNAQAGTSETSVCPESSCPLGSYKFKSTSVNKVGCWSCLVPQPCLA